MNPENIGRELRRARLFRWMGFAIFASVMLFGVLFDGAWRTMTGAVLFYGGITLGAGLGGYASAREVSLRREQRRHDREEYRQLTAKQRMN